MSLVKFELMVTRTWSVRHSFNRKTPVTPPYLAFHEKLVMTIVVISPL